MKRIPLILSLLLITSLSITSIAQSDCPTMTAIALNQTDQHCLNTGRNQACFGHVDLSVKAQSDASNFEFVEVGDIVDVAEIQSLRLSALDTTQGTWGIVLMRVQPTDLPNTAPAQNVTFILFGDTEIQNYSTSVADQNIPTLNAQVNASTDVDVWVGTSNSTDAVLVSLANGSDVIARGISPDKEWIGIVVPNSDIGQLGWVQKEFLTTDGDFDSLKIVEPGQPLFGPMQAFYLSTGVGQSTCADLPDNWSADSNASRGR